MRLILDGTVVRVPARQKGDLDLAARGVIGVRADGAEGAARDQEHGRRRRPAAWRALLDDLVRRGSASGRSSARRRRRAGPREGGRRRCGPGVAVQRCTVHKHRNLLAHAPERLHEEITARLQRHDLRRDAPRRSRHGARPSSANGRLKRRAVADSLEEAGDGSFTFTRSAAEPMAKSIRTSNAIERLARGVQAPDQDADCAAIAPTLQPCCFWALLASGQIDHAQGRRTGRRSPTKARRSDRLTSPRNQIASSCWRSRRGSNHIPDGTASRMTYCVLGRPAGLGGPTLSRGCASCG